MTRILFYAILIGAIGYIISHILKFLSDINSTKSQLEKDKVAFSQNLDRDDLVKWHWSELNTLSMALDFGISKFNMISSAREGDFISIFNEPIAHMLSKEYGDRELLYIVTEEDVFELYKSDTGKISFQLNGNQKADVKITSKEFKMNLAGDQYFLRKNRGKGEIILNEKSITTTNSSKEGSREMQRVIQIVPDPIKPNQEKIVKFLLLFYLIWQDERA